jgi:hypothetical protein
MKYFYLSSDTGSFLRQVLRKVTPAGRTASRKSNFSRGRLPFSDGLDLLVSLNSLQNPLPTMSDQSSGSSSQDNSIQDLRDTEDTAQNEDTESQDAELAHCRSLQSYIDSVLRRKGSVTADPGTSPSILPWQNAYFGGANDGTADG